MEFVFVDSGSEDNIMVGVEKIEEYFEKYADDYTSRDSWWGADIDDHYHCLDQDTMHNSLDCFPYYVVNPKMGGEPLGEPGVKYSFYGAWEVFDGVILAEQGLNLDELLGDLIWQGGFSTEDIPHSVFIPYGWFYHTSPDDLERKFTFEIEKRY